MEKPLFSIELNEFEKPTGNYEIDLKRLAISLGLMRPGDSREAIVSILDILLKARKEKPEGLTSVEITARLYERNKTIVYANILRDLRKMIAVGLVEKINNKYRIRENMSLPELFNKVIKPFVIERVLTKISEYTEAVENELKS